LFVLGQVKPGSERALKAKAIMERQVAHLARLVDDLLDVTRITRGTLQLRRAHVDLEDLVRQTVEDHRNSLDEKGLTLQMSVDSGPYWVHADSARLVQALSNLLANAEKFTPRGGRVLVTLRHEDGQGTLEIRDTGIGIAGDLGQHLFEPFVQAPQTMERASGGLGLGLAMVKAVVELHRGKVAIASEGIGKGTTITLSLPLTTAPPSDEGRAAAGPQGPRRVLVIEDNLDAAESLRDALALGGHEVEVAADGPSGIEKARQFQPGIVICDIGLPGMDGYQVARRLREDAALRDTYLVALTGYARPEDLERAADAGFDQHVAKPATVERLCQLLVNLPPAPASPRATAHPPT
jgi:two-component system CheB/CheR fusion protein